MADGQAVMGMPPQTLVPPEGNLSLSVGIRPVRRADLEALEWFGLHTPHREIILQGYTMQECGNGLMLIAEVNGFPTGQICIDYARKRHAGRATLWALRVFPTLRGAGLGTRLMTAAEQAVMERGISETELGVDRDNARVLPFYERLGYEGCGTEQGSFSYRTPGGELVRLPIDQWVLRKRLHPAPAGRREHRCPAGVLTLPPSR